MQFCIATCRDLHGSGVSEHSKVTKRDRADTARRFPCASQHSSEGNCIVITQPCSLPATTGAGPPRGPAVPPQFICAAEKESVRPARRFVREAVAYQVPDVPTDAVDTLELLASELVTNAYRYGSEPGDSLQVVVDAEPGRCRIEVHDTRRKRPKVLPASDERGRGRGLFLVGLMASRWGTADRPMGKIVWAVVTW
ncbi:ATP-binding protein [Streptomyces sp. DT20]|uniref:ATP-binding protein n=1 Tax=Streptomyces sp. DT20 TaxID=3416519 RepID=UPI003CE833BD